MKVKLKSEIIDKIRHPHSPKSAEIREALSVELRKFPYERASRVTLWSLLKFNEWNGNLTKENVLQCLETVFETHRDNLIDIDYEE